MEKTAAIKLMLPNGKQLVYTQVRQLLRKILGTCIGVNIRNQVKVTLPMLKVMLFMMSYQNETNMKDLPRAADTSLSFDLEEVYVSINQCANFSQLQDYIDMLNDEELPSLEKPILQAGHNAKVKSCLFLIPKGCTVGFSPFETTGDGNCFPQAISRALFGDESHHKEIRLHLVIEGVKNKVHYLDNTYLSLGASHINKRGTFPQQYAMFSGQ